MLEDAIHILKEKTQAPDIRFDAILYIVDRFESEYFPVFEDILDDESDNPDVRSAVALALGKIGKAETTGESPLRILSKHVNSENKTVKNYVIQALGMLGKEEAAPILINALKDKSNTIFASAAEALGQLGKPVVPHLIELLSQGADDARCVAAWQLGELRYAEAVPALVKVIQEDRNTDVQALCIWALGEIGHSTQEVIDILHWAKEQEEPDLRLRAELAIKKIVRHSN